MLFILAQDELYNRTTLHPVGILLLLILGAATFLSPRRYALVPMLVMACFVASGQRIVLATLDFNFLRLLVAVGWMRVFLRQETIGFRWRTIDTVFMLWLLSATVSATILHTSVSTLVNRLGLMYDAVGIYFLTRMVVREWRTVFSIAAAAALISLPVAAAFLLEKSTGRNMFSVFGGVLEYTTVRAGRLRCRGPFSHPILAGYFWAALMPLIAALWWHPRGNRILVIAGLIASVVVVITCSSATPLGAMIAGGLAGVAFAIRRRISLVRWASAVGLIILQCAMVNPVWHLFARIPLVQGATGWYRYVLMDDFINHIGDWWLIGTESRDSWWAQGAYAITNEYVMQGIEGGLLTLLLFIFLIAAAFRAVGRTSRRAAAARRLSSCVVDGVVTTTSRAAAPHSDRKARIAMAWALGVALFIHCVAFFGVTCFGQAVLVWYLTLGIIGSMTPAAVPYRQHSLFAWPPVCRRSPEQMAHSLI